MPWFATQKSGVRSRYRSRRVPPRMRRSGRRCRPDQNHALPTCLNVSRKGECDDAQELDKLQPGTMLSACIASIRASWPARPLCTKGAPRGALVRLATVEALLLFAAWRGRRSVAPTLGLRLSFAGRLRRRRWLIWRAVSCRTRSLANLSRFGGNRRVLGGARG